MMIGREGFNEAQKSRMYQDPDGGWHIALYGLTATQTQELIRELEAERGDYGMRVSDRVTYHPTWVRVDLPKHIGSSHRRRDDIFRRVTGITNRIRMHKR